MVRPRSSSFALLAPTLIVLSMTAAACGGAPEEAQIRQFFRASQLRDSQTLANFSSVAFEPGTDGVVQSFEITSVSPETSEPLRIRELTKAHEEALAAEEEFSKKKKEYQDANLEAIDRVLKAESANRPIRGRDAEVQTAWAKWREETAMHARSVSEARNALNSATPIAELSVETGRTPVDLGTVEGQLVTKEVTVDARVRQPDNETVSRTLVMTMQRVVGKSNGTDVTGRWIISGLRTAG